MIKTMFISLIALALSLSVYLFFYLGIYKSVEITVAKRGPMYMFYKNHTGAYHLIGPVIQEVEDMARSQKLVYEKTFGEYVDSPERVDQDRLRSHGGCLLNEPPDQVPAGFVFEQRPEKEYVIAHFSGSPSIGPFKVYPKVKKYLEEQHLTSHQPVIETYSVHGANVDTEFLFPLDAPPNTN